MLGAAQRLGKKTILVNAVLQEVGGFGSVFVRLNCISVREPRSALEAKRIGAATVSVVPDSCLEADFVDDPLWDFENEVVVGSRG